MSFKVVVADNFHCMDEGESHEHGTLELARYKSFVEDPYIVAQGSTGVIFSARSYAGTSWDS